MRVVKRNGSFEEVSFDKVLTRIKNLSHGLEIDPVSIAQKVCSRIYDGVQTYELDDLAAQICSSLIVDHPDFDTLATRITVSNHHKRTSPSFSETVQILYDNHNEEGVHTPLVSKKIYEVTMNNKEKLNTYIQYDRDYNFNFFGFKTLEKSYLFRKNGVVIERPQHLLMRVALGIHEEDFKDALETYDAMSTKRFIHATPTLFNSGTPRPQMSSCFLAEVSDSIDGIYKSLHECAHISKYAGGIGLHIHKVRGKDSTIRGTNGKSSGIVPMLRVFNATARYVNQCFVPETIIYTDRGVKPIKDIVEGDKVLTRDGTYQPVIHTVKNNVKKSVLEIFTKYAIDKVRCTREHQIYAIRGQRKGMNYSTIKSRMEKKLIQPEYVSASELTEDDMLGFPIATMWNRSQDCEEKNVEPHKNTSLIDPYMFVYGATIRFSQPAAVYRAKVDESGHQTIPCRAPVVSPVYDNLRGALDQLNIAYTVLNGYISWESPFDRFSMEDLPWGTDLLNIETVTKSQVTSFVDGLFAHNHRAVTCSKAMAHSIRRICMLLGTIVNTNVVTRFLNDMKTYEMSALSSAGKKNIAFVHDGMLWMRIQSIEEFVYDGEVYDLNVKDNHNYTTDMGLVHNSGRRNGSIAMYLEPWHPDVFQFLEMKKNHGAEEQRARDLFYALWIPDLFMERVERNAKWSLMCPDMCKDLCELYGDAFKKRYEEYEVEGRFVRQVNAQDIWFKIMESQIETGTPYMLYKDAVNHKSNQKNLGTIKSSNLCVAGDTNILTDEGYKRIDHLVGRFVNVWNGFEWSQVQVQRTSQRSKLIRVAFSNGRSIRCTPYHKFFIEDSRTTREVCVQAYELNLGMKLSHFNTPVIPQFKERECDCTSPVSSSYDRFFEDAMDAYTHAFLCAKRRSLTWLVDENRVILKQREQNALRRLHYTHAYHMVNQSTCVKIKTNEQTQRTLPGVAPTNASLKARLEWLTGYIDAAGYIQKDHQVWVLGMDVSKNMMDSLYLMLCTMGIHPICDPHRITISNDDVQHLLRYGLRCEVVDMQVFHKPASFRMTEPIRIVGVEDHNEYEPTYCFTEKRRNRGMFDGVVIGNCTEITEYTDENETAVCNLASMCLPSYVIPAHPSELGSKPTYDFDALHKHVKIVVKNLNKIIDKNYYPVPKAETSNMRHRPIGIGVQGLADAFLLMRMPFDSPEAAQLNRDIFETMYHAALEESMEISKRRHDIITEHNKRVLENDIDNESSEDHLLSPWSTYVRINKYERDAKIESSKYPGAYITFEGSPASQGILQFDMWGVKVSNDRYNWDKLKELIRNYGLRNSLLMAPMPTASTSQIMGFNEAFEPFTSNLYKRKTIAGEFIVANQYLIRDLINLGIWNKSLKEKLLLEDGSIQNIKEIPQEIRDLYKVVWDIKQRVIIDQAADRGAFICQSQSMNLFTDDPNFSKLTSMYFYAWRKGLKTGLYYLRTKPKATAQQFTIDPKTKSKWLGAKDEDDESTCFSCSA